jgi:rare lipoprotein A
LRARHLILLLAACSAIPAGADTISNKSAVHGVSEKALTADGAVPASGAIPNPSFYSESTRPAVPEASNEGIRLRSDLGSVVQRGTASWYGPGFHGRKSAGGERFNMHSMTAAHPNLPLLSWVLVRNVHNNKVALLKVTDRGPYRSKRILDVSYAAAKQLGFVRNGTAQVEVRRLSHSEASWVRRQLDEGSDVSAADDVHSSVNTSDESAAKVQQQEPLSGH